MHYVELYGTIMETETQKLVSEDNEVYMELREQILEGTLQVFNYKGLKFTMDDVAHTLGISKKTIYTVFSNKQEMFLELVDYLFDGIKDEEQKVMDDDSLSTVDKIRKILGVMPVSYRELDLRQLYILKDKYPVVYHKVEQRLENGWENTISLIEQGIAEGVIRPIKIPILKMMLEASLEQFFIRDVLIENKITYSEGLDEVVEILVDGILLNSTDNNKLGRLQK